MIRWLTTNGKWQDILKSKKKKTSHFWPTMVQISLSYAEINLKKNIFWNQLTSTEEYVKYTRRNISTENTHLA